MTVLHHLILYSFFRVDCVKVNEDRHILNGDSVRSVDFSDEQIMHKFAG